MSIQVPPGALGAAFGVLIYSFFCLTCSCFLFWLIWIHRERTSYVAMLAFFTSLGTTASIIQQFHTIIDWNDIKLAQFANQQANADDPELAITGGSLGLDLVLFYIQFYCYNVEALLVLFWAAELVHSIFQIRLLKQYRVHAGIVAKAASVLLPVVQACLLRTNVLLSSTTVVYLVVANVLMASSLCSGSLLLIVILGKYVYTRRAFMSWNVRYGQGSSTEASASRASTLHHPTRQNIYDKWLVVRFTIAFIALGAFELANIFFEVLSIKRVNLAGQSDQADLSAARANSSFALFMPGVTASLITFVVFGTTRPFREYMWDTFVPLGIRERRMVKKSNRVPSMVLSRESRREREPSSLLELRAQEGWTPMGSDDIRLQEMGLGQIRGKRGAERIGKQGGNLRDDDWPALTVSPVSPLRSTF